MKIFKIQDFLAPTWSERLKAEQAILAELMEDLEEINYWGEEIQQEISKLKPSPEVFLSALIAFWSDITEKNYLERMKAFNDKPHPYSAKKWSSPHLVKFPMTPKIIPEAGMLMPGIWVWSFISKLGCYCNMIEPQLVACLSHPEPIVSDAVEKAFGSVDTISDESFIGILKFADEQGRNGNIWDRSKIIAKHVDKARLEMVLKGLEPNVCEKLSITRFHIIQYLNTDLAKVACEYLIKKLTQSWSDKQLADLIYTFSKQLHAVKFDQKELELIENLAKHSNENIRSAVAGLLSNLNPNKYLQTLMKLSNDSHAWVLMSLCLGLTKQKNLPRKLVENVLSRSLGNFDGCDGEPHYSAIQLLVKTGNDSNLYIDIIQKWWDGAVEDDYLEYEEITNILDVIDNLGESALVFINSLEKALVKLTNDEEIDDYPSLDEPNAVPEIKQKFKEKMIASGATDKDATQVAEFQGALLDIFANNADEIQAEFDKGQEQYEDEMRANFGDDWDFDEEEYEDETEEEYEDEEAEEVVRLKAKILELHEKQK